jgi:DMSO/TMAO reductase YedYZ molybdopterin-dependent catalytic subunit
MDGRRPESEAPELQPGERRIGRRMFLALTAAGGAALALGGQGLDGLGRLPILRGLMPEGGWFFYTVSDVEPAFDGRSWDLRIEGLVENPTTLTFTELLALRQSKQVHDYHCVTGWSVSQVHWEGPLVSTLLDLVRPRPEATAVSFDSADGVYVDSLSFREARRPEVLLAHHLNGAPLPQDRGAALRLVVPFMYGYKGVKWVSRIRLTATQEVGYWEQRGYDVDAYLQ